MIAAATSYTRTYADFDISENFCFGTSVFYCAVALQHSPPQFQSEGRTGDLDAILQVINAAQHYIFVAVMEYFPIFLYQKPVRCVSEFK